LGSSDENELAGMRSVDVEEREVTETLISKEIVNQVHLVPGPGVLGPFESSPNNSHFWLNNPSFKNPGHIPNVSPNNIGPHYKAHCVLE
jgi:hypothetical protein